LYIIKTITDNCRDYRADNILSQDVSGRKLRIMNSEMKSIDFFPLFTYNIMIYNRKILL